MLVKDGALTVPLFHGTSSFFVGSILQNGLGGRNPVQEFQVIPLLRSLHEACESTIPSDSTWLAMKWLVEQMISQKNAKFRHGLAFLSPSRVTAVRYAASNTFGSEAISTAARLYELLTESGRVDGLNTWPTMFPVVELFKKPASPVLVEALSVRVTDLQGEQGQTAQQVIDDLEQLLSRIDMKLFEKVSQQYNFSLAKPLEARRLRLYNINVIRYDLAFPDYELAPLERC